MRTSSLLALLLPIAACATGPSEMQAEPVVPSRPMVLGAGKPVPDIAGEKHFRNVRQLTFGGENAEAYFSNDGRKLIMQCKRPPYECDQIYVLDLETGEEQMVSTGKGRTTCAYFLQGDSKILYSSTHLESPDCPTEPVPVRGRYVWGVFPSYDVFVANPDGSDLERITETEGYDAEATVCPVTGRIVFTSVRDGDLELYSMEPDGSDVRRLTERLGYDGGAFYSHDGSKIVLRSGFPETEDEKAEYKDFLSRGLVVPSKMEITVVNADGTGFRKVTDNGVANFAPFWHPDDRRILFSSNLSGGRNFDIYMVNEDGTGLERLTHHEEFDGFPMFSPDGRYLVFGSNRYGKERGETNIFIAEWVE